MIITKYLTGGRSEFVAFDDEIHNESVLMKRLEGRKPASMFYVSLFWRDALVLQLKSQFK